MNRTRLVLSWVTIILLAVGFYISLFTGMANVAVSCVGAIAAVASLYIGGETYRPSLKP